MPPLYKRALKARAIIMRAPFRGPELAHIYVCRCPHP